MATLSLCRVALYICVCVCVCVGKSEYFCVIGAARAGVTAAGV